MNGHLLSRVVVARAPGTGWRAPSWCMAESMIDRTCRPAPVTAVLVAAGFFCGSYLLRSHMVRRPNDGRPLHQTLATVGCRRGSIRPSHASCRRRFSLALVPHCAPTRRSGRPTRCLLYQAPCTLRSLDHPCAGPHVAGTGAARVATRGHRGGCCPPLPFFFSHGGRIEPIRSHNPPVERGGRGTSGRGSDGTARARRRRCRQE